MKKLVAIAILAVTAASAFAAGGQVAIEYERQNLTGGSYVNVPAKGLDLNTVSVAPGLKFGNTLVDVKLGTTSSVQDINGAKLDSVAVYEVRGKQYYRIGEGLVATARVGLGYNTFAGQNVKYYFIEPGVEYALNSAITFNGGWRYTNDFESKVYGQEWLGRGNRATVGVDYRVTGNDVIGLKAYRQLGDVDMTGVNVGYVRLF